MISIRRSSKLHLWTLYWHGKAIAGVTSPTGLFIGKLIVLWVGRLLASYDHRRLL